MIIASSATFAALVPWVDGRIRNEAVESFVMTAPKPVFVGEIFAPGVH